MRAGILRGAAWRRLSQGVLIFLAVFGTARGSVVQDNAGDGAICGSASRYASAQTGVPLDILRAISLTETGRRSGGRLKPWPWTVNMQGAGKWFETRDQALKFTERNFARGARSFDVGCFQINYRWHGGAFPSINAMFDPKANALYAARFLRTLFDETGSWPGAAGAYHSRTPKLAAAYQQRFQRILARLEPAEASGRRELADAEPSGATRPRPPQSILNGALLASQRASDDGITSPGSLVILSARSNGWNILTPARGALN